MRAPARRSRRRQATKPVFLRLSRSLHVSCSDNTGSNQAAEQDPKRHGVGIVQIGQSSCRDAHTRRAARQPSCAVRPIQSSGPKALSDLRAASQLILRWRGGSVTVSVRRAESGHLRVFRPQVQAAVRSALAAESLTDSSTQSHRKASKIVAQLQPENA